MTPNHIEVLVEDYSTKAALENLLPKILPANVSSEIRSFQGKTDLLKKLPQRLQGYRAWLPDDWRIVVLCDRDNQDCQALKQQLEDYARDTGFTTKSSATDDQFTILNRIAIEELEAWFLGDAAAINRAYPKIPTDFTTRKRYRNPDTIKGAWEALEALLQGKKYHLGGLNKVEAARNISQYMEPDRNCSESFQCFYQGLRSVLSCN